MATILCPKCGASNEAGTLNCVTCGTLLFNPSTTTVHMRVNPALLRLRHDRQNESPATAPERTIVLQIRGMSERLTFDEGSEIILGRTDLAASAMRRLDLSPYGAHERGVSRDHAVLRYSDHSLTLTDLSSANGTSVNLIKLAPNQPKALNNGDEFMVGTLSIVVHFEPTVEAKPPASTRVDETIPLPNIMNPETNGTAELKPRKANNLLDTAKKSPVDKSVDKPASTDATSTSTDKK